MRGDTSTFTPNFHLSTPEKLKKLADLALEKNASRKKIALLSAKVKALCAEDSVSVDPSLDADLVEAAFQCFSGSSSSYRHCRARIRQHRWHPLIIKWCLNSKMMLGAAYHNMRTSGMLALPSERTFRDYSNVVKAGDGFNLDVLRQLFDEARMGE